MNELFPQGVPAMFNGQVKDALMPVDDSTFAKIQHLYEALALVLRDKPVSRSAALSIIRPVLCV